MDISPRSSLAVYQVIAVGIGGIAKLNGRTRKQEKIDDDAIVSDSLP